MTQKHNFIFKTVTCLIMASAIFVLTSFVLPDTNVVEAKQLSCISYESPAPATDAEVKEPAIEKAKVSPQVEKESVDVNTPAIPYTEEDLDLLARLITAEMGASWVSDEMQLYVGSVVINRMNHELFPDTLYDVIYAKGQYSPTWNGTINNTPDERTIENARQLLEHGSVLPENVVFQANFPQGDGTYYEYYDEVLGTTTYFCYLSN